MYKFGNNDTAKLAAAILSSDTSLTVEAGRGALFPALSGGDVFRATLNSTDGATMEIVEVTARAGDVFTITRAQEGTTAAGFSAGAIVSNFVTREVAESWTQRTEDIAGAFNVSATDKVLGRSTSGAGVIEEIACTSAGRALLDDADAAAQRTTLDVYSTSEVDAAVAAGTGSLAMDSLSDVVITSPATDDVLTYDGANWVNQVASGLSSRATATVTTASLANGANEDGTVTLAKTAAILRLTVDRGCWVRLYQTSGDRTDDAGRTLGTPPSETTNILAEWSFAGSGTLRRLPVLVTNGDGSPTASIYYAITNESGSTSTVQVDFTWLKLEA